MYKVVKQSRGVTYINDNLSMSKRVHSRRRNLRCPYVPGGSILRGGRDSGGPGTQYEKGVGLISY